MSTTHVQDNILSLLENDWIHLKESYQEKAGSYKEKQKVQKKMKKFLFKVESLLKIATFSKETMNTLENIQQEIKSVLES